jgi:hypothetical protein
VSTAKTATHRQRADAVAKAAERYAVAAANQKPLDAARAKLFAALETLVGGKVSVMPPFTQPVPLPPGCNSWAEAEKEYGEPQDDRDD